MPSPATKGLLVAFGVAVVAVALCVPAWLDDLDRIVTKAQAAEHWRHWFSWLPQVYALLVSALALCTSCSKNRWWGTLANVLCVLGLPLVAVSFALASIPLTFSVCCCAPSLCVLAGTEHEAFFRLGECATQALDHCDGEFARVSAYWAGLALLVVALSLVLSAGAFRAVERRRKADEYRFFVQQSRGAAEEAAASRGRRGGVDRAGGAGGAYSQVVPQAAAAAAAAAAAGAGGGGGAVEDDDDMEDDLEDDDVSWTSNALSPPEPIMGRFGV